MTPRGLTIKERLDAKTFYEPNTGCWLWSGSSVRGGYGQIGISRKLTLAHRVSYTEYVGLIPAGLLVLHRCDTPPCINPDHLFLGTTADNTADKIKKGRQPNGESMYNSKLIYADIIKIHGMIAAGMTQRYIAGQFGVNTSLISRINAGKRWKHVTVLEKEE